MVKKAMEEAFAVVLNDFRTATRDHTLELFTADAKVIRHTAGQCLKRVDLGRRLRLLGVRVGKLARADSEQAPAPGFIAAPVTSGHKTAEPGGADGTLDLFQDYSGGWPG